MRTAARIFSAMVVSVMVICALAPLAAADSNEGKGTTAEDPCIIEMLVGQNFCYYPQLPDYFQTGLEFSITGTARDFINQELTDDHSTVKIHGTPSSPGTYDLTIKVVHREYQYIRFLVYKVPSMTVNLNGNANVTKDEESVQVGYDWDSNGDYEPVMTVTKNDEPVNVTWITNNTQSKYVYIDAFGIDDEEYGIYTVTLTLDDLTVNRTVIRSFNIFVTVDESVVYEVPELSDLWDVNISPDSDIVEMPYSYVTNDVSAPTLSVKREGATVNVDWVTNDTENRKLIFRPSLISSSDYGDYVVGLTLRDTVVDGTLTSTCNVHISNYSITAPEKKSFGEGERVEWRLTSNATVDYWTVDLGNSGLEFDESTSTVFGYTKTSTADRTYSVRVRAAIGPDTAEYIWTFNVKHTVQTGGITMGSISKGDNAKSVVLHTDTVGHAYTIWDMDDGNTVRQEAGDNDVIYTYSNAGTYHILQTSFSSDGKAFTVEEYIYVISSMAPAPLPVNNPDKNESAEESNNTPIVIAAVGVGAVLLALVLRRFI